MDSSLVDQLRNRHSRLRYDQVQYQVDGEQLQITWQFVLEPEFTFTSKVTFAGLNAELLRAVPKDVLHNLAFQLGLVELISYWKLACPPEIVINAGWLNPKQQQWWQDLTLNGLGEFFYVNDIDFTQPEFMRWVNGSLAKADAAAHQPVYPEALAATPVIVPVGGGKDSVVTMELLKAGAQKISPWTVYEIGSQAATITAAGFGTWGKISRQLDPQLFELNKQGYLNGHTPFSAWMAFAFTIVSVIQKQKYIAVSNEGSANECNVVFHGREINHQYSKSFAFEQAFRDYAQKYLASESEYFSFLRPLHELQIAKLFSRYPHHFPNFKSCNRGQKTNSWCHDCPKCLFAFTILAPFIEQKVLTTNIFNHNLFEKSELIPTALDLVIEDHVKPFECVGSYHETKVAFWLAADEYRKQNLPLPPVLAAIDEQVLQPSQLDFAAEAVRLLHDWQDQHAVPAPLSEILRTATQTL